MKQRHLFILDPIKNLNFQMDTSLKLARELALFDHEIFGTTIADLFWNRGQESPGCRAFQLFFTGVGGEDSPTFDVQANPPSSWLLRSFSSVHMRKEPPLDINYFAVTWLLDQVSRQVKIYNAPDILRKFNEKAGILQYPAETAPALISSDYPGILDFLEKECAGDGIIKPLDQFGGRGIFRCRLDDEASVRQLEQALADGRMRIIQPFDQAVLSGEVRVFTLAGDALCWCLKTPKEGSFLANTGAGSTLTAFEPDQELKKRVERIAKDLYRQGVVLCGMDLIGGRVSEINITSPRLLHPDPDQRDYYSRIARWIRDDCAHQNKPTNRYS